MVVKIIWSTDIRSNVFMIWVQTVCKSYQQKELMECYIDTGLDKQIFEHKTVNIFLPTSFNIETVLLSNHNIICFG